MFQLPIQYNTHKEVDSSIIQELELVDTVDTSVVPVYNHVFSPTSR